MSEKCQIIDPGSTNNCGFLLGIGSNYATLIPHYAEALNIKTKFIRYIFKWFFN